MKWRHVRVPRETFSAPFARDPWDAPQLLKLVQPVRDKIFTPRMTEREMEDLLYSYPHLLLGEPLKPVSRQSSSPVGRADLVFEHPRGYRVIVEVKVGVAPRGVGEQLHDYWGAEKVAHPDIPVEMMVVANEIPRERRLYLENRNIEAREIPAKKFRDVASAVGYKFTSEESLDSHAVADAAARREQPLSSVTTLPIAVSCAEGLPALFHVLEPANLEGVFDYFSQPRGTDLVMGTNCSLRRAKEQPIGRVYFKAIGRNEVSARAELIDIFPDQNRTELPNPATRLRGYEEERNTWYYSIRCPERLACPIPVGDFISLTTRHNLRNDTQGVRLVLYRDSSPPSGAPTKVRQVG